MIFLFIIILLICIIKNLNDSTIKNNKEYSKDKLIIRIFTYIFLIILLIGSFKKSNVIYKYKHGWWFITTCSIWCSGCVYFR